jgi:hypothetical protein
MISTNYTFKAMNVAMIFVFRNHILFGFSHIFLNGNVKFHICFLIKND